MASVSKHGTTGRRMIQFTGADGKRKTIRLGFISEDQADLVAFHVDNLARAKREGLAVETNTARWLAKLDGSLADKLAKVGLTEDRTPATVGQFTRAYIDSRKDVKPRSKINLEQARKYLVEFLERGGPAPLASITEGKADEYRRWLREQVGENTTRRHCGRAKQFFRAACRKRMLDSNPFADMKNLSVGANRERDYFVTREEAGKVLEACPDAQWQLLFALSRYGGLRCPSEHLALTWADIDWETSRMVVRSPKTARHEGKERRIVPIFAELRPYLKAAHDEALAAADQGKPLGYVITIPSIRRDRYANIRTRLENIILRAGLSPWPKLTHNLRATRETELAATFPEHVVCEWIGNSSRVARKHYLRVTEADVARAAGVDAASAANRAADALQNALQQPGCQPMPNAAKSGFGSVGQHTAPQPVPPAGFEPATC